MKKEIVEKKVTKIMKMVLEIYLVPSFLICWDINPIVPGGSEVALKHGAGGLNLAPPAKIQTTKAVDLKLGTLIK